VSIHHIVSAYTVMHSSNIQYIMCFNR